MVVDVEKGDANLINNEIHAQPSGRLIRYVATWSQ